MDQLGCQMDQLGSQMDQLGSQMDQLGRQMDQLLPCDLLLMTCKVGGENDVSNLCFTFHSEEPLLPFQTNSQW